VFLVETWLCLVWLNSRSFPTLSYKSDDSEDKMGARLSLYFEGCYLFSGQPLLWQESKRGALLYLGRTSFGTAFAVEHDSSETR
jgi:hypothetical protein